MKKSVSLMVIASAVVLTYVSWGAVDISNVKIQQRYPWNGKVDVWFNLDSSRSNVTVRLTARNLLVDEPVTVSSVEMPDGRPLTSPFVAHPGANHFVWNASKDLPAGFVSDNMSLCVTVQTGVVPKDKLYCVIDVSGGTSADSYPVFYLNAMPRGGWSDEYKKTKIVLRRIFAGTFSMGSVDMGSYLASSQTNRTVTISKDYYMGIFEVTQRQYELVTGANPSTYKGDMRPVETVSWYQLRGGDRGAQYADPRYRYSKDLGTFLRLLSDKSGLYALDLPTEAEWEYACRAGATTPFNDNVAYNANDVANGGFMAVANLMRNRDTCFDGRGNYSEHTTVGLYQPNSWGLYDMHGNVAELCLDPSSDQSWQLPSSAVDGLRVTDPLEVGLYTAIRGGAWSYNAWYCRAGIVVNLSRDASNYPYAYQTVGNVGFRIAIGN